MRALLVVVTAALLLLMGGCKPFCSATSTICGGPQTTHSNP
jgi:hypothetical protein